MNDSFAAVALYVGLNALLLLALTFAVALQRGAQKALEPGAMEDASLTRAIRAHANFTEYTPIVLLMLVALALTNTAALPIHMLGGVFTIARVFHAIGMLNPKHPNALRFVGSATTVLVLLGGGGLCLLRFYETLS